MLGWIQSNSWKIQSNAWKVLSLPPATCCFALKLLSEDQKTLPNKTLHRRRGGVAVTIRMESNKIAPFPLFCTWFTSAEAEKRADDSPSSLQPSLYGSFCLQESSSPQKRVLRQMASYLGNKGTINSIISVCELCWWIQLMVLLSSI